MYCRYCGKQVEDDSEFCPQCGKKLLRDQTTLGVEGEDLDPLTPSSKCEDVTTISEPQMTTDSVEDVPVSKTGKKFPVRLLAVVGVVVLCSALLTVVVFFANHRELSAGEIAKLSNSVLTLYVYDEDHELIATGSGFVVNDNRTIVTNYHVIDQGHFVEAVSEKDVHYNADGATFFDEDSDIAILQLETATDLRPLAIADSSSVKVGDTVYAIGSPLGLKNTVSNGIISALRENGTYSDFQITAPISSGSSGGVLLNTYGEAIGITYASYSGGQNLNLAIPSVEFVDKLQEDDIQGFEDIALFAAPLGNSVENYSTHDTRLVQYGDYIFEAYNSDNEINVYDINTKKTKRLGIQGTNLSVYRGVLYYVSSEGTIGTYDIDTEEIRENILRDYPASARVDTIKYLYVSNHGLSVIYKTGFLKTALIQLGFDGTVIGRVDGLSYHPVIADEDTLVDTDYKNWELEFISLSDMERVSILLDFEPDSICPSQDGFLYISDTTDGRYEDLVKYDLYSGEYSQMYKLDASTYGCFCNNGQIYYPAVYGTGKMSDLGTGWEALTKEYELNYMCFSDDGKLYAIGTEPTVNTITAERYMEYYLCIDLATNQIEVLDKDEIVW